MRAKLFISCLVGAMLLTGCGNSSNNVTSTEEIKNYHIVKFMYNSGFKPGEAYLNVVVYNDEAIQKPADPNIENYVFGGWYTDASCKTEYLRWGLQLDEDLTLYAKWTMYREISDVEKITSLQETLNDMSSNVYKVNAETKAEVAYPALYDQIFAVNDEYVFNRYSDIVIKDYYQVQDDGTKWHYGQEQFSYDNRYFYDIYHDFDDSTQNSADQKAFDASKLESFLNIGFANTNRTVQDLILHFGERVTSEKVIFDYSFTGNYTSLKNIKNGNYTFTEYVYLAQYSETGGTYITEEYQFDYILNISNSKIKSASIRTDYIYAVGEEVYYQIADESYYDYFYNDGNYQAYTGTRF